jgi:hypothetical protein
VNSSPALKWLLIVLVPLTLGWKLVGEGRISSGAKIDIIDFLSHQGFEVRKRILGDFPFIDATAKTDACRMTVFEVSPDGWTRDIARQILGETKYQFFVFRGNIYTEQPTWLTLSDHLWSRAVRKIGFARLDVPVIAVSVAGPCHPERLPWHELWSHTSEIASAIPE